MYREEVFMRDVETLFPVARVKVNGEQVWPYLRVPFATYLQLGDYVSRGERRAYDMDPSASKRGALTAASYGLRHWIGRYDYIAIGLAHDRRWINGERVNRFLDPIIDELGRDRVLFVEQPTPRHDGHERTKHLVSEGLLLGIRQALLRVRKTPPVIENIEVLNAIQKAYRLNINSRAKVRNFQTLRGIWRMLYRVVKPQAVFLTNYYGFAHPALKAAHDCGIPVIEVQHGTISRSHVAYNAFTELDKSFFADYLLTFGRNEWDTFSDGRVISLQRVVPVGVYYVDYVRKTFEPDERLAKWIGTRISVGVSLQLGYEKFLVNFVAKAAALDASIAWVFLPRVADNYLTAFPADGNMLVYTDRDFCRIVPQFDFHVTVSSTTALEAPSLGIRNVIVDMDGEGKRVLGEQSPESDITHYVHTPQELLDAVRMAPYIPKDEIMVANANNIEPDYMRNIKRFLGGVR